MGSVGLTQDRDNQERDPMRAVKTLMSQIVNSKNGLTITTRLKVPFRLKSPRIDCKSLMWQDVDKMRRMFKLNCLKEALIALCGKIS